VDWGLCCGRIPAVEIEQRRLDALARATQTEVIPGVMFVGVLVHTCVVESVQGCCEFLMMEDKRS